MPSPFRAPRASQSGHGCACRRRRPGSPARGLRGGGVRLMPAVESGERGFSVSQGRLPRTPFPFPLRHGSGRETAASPPSSRALQQLPHGRSLVRWARERALLPRGCPCRARAPPAAPRAPVTGLDASRAAAARVRMRIRDPAGERVPAARLVPPVRQPSRLAARLGPLRERPVATESSTAEVG